MMRVICSDGWGPFGRFKGGVIAAMGSLQSLDQSALDLCLEPRLPSRRLIKTWLATFFVWWASNDRTPTPRLIWWNQQGLTHPTHPPEMWNCTRPPALGYVLIFLRPRQQWWLRSVRFTSECHRINDGRRAIHRVNCFHCTRRSV